MNTTELAEKIARKHDLARPAARDLVDSIFESIVEEAASGREVTISGFGRFASKAVSPRIGRNPRTGAQMAIPATRKPVFTPAKKFKDKVLEAQGALPAPRLVHAR